MELRVKITSNEMADLVKKLSQPSKINGSQIIFDADDISHQISEALKEQLSEALM